jgi:hypothetical protein
MKKYTLRRNVTDPANPYQYDRDVTFKRGMRLHTPIQKDKKKEKEQWQRRTIRQQLNKMQK